MRRTLWSVAVAAGLTLPTLVALGAAHATVSSAPPAPGYDFRLLATIPGAAPGGGTFTRDFEPNGLNGRGDALFGADLLTVPIGEGVWITRAIAEVARFGQAAPGGGTFGTGFLGPTSINDVGDAALAWRLDPAAGPGGALHTGVYRYSNLTGTLEMVMRSDVTPAPGGGFLRGARFATSINNRNDLLFHGIINTPFGTGNPAGLGVGIFRADRSNSITQVLVPGDPAPGGGTFDNFRNAWINDRGDIAFGGHVTGEECVAPSAFNCGESIYVRWAASGDVESIAHQGAPAPGGGTYRIAFGPRINNNGDILFVGDLTPAPAFGVTRALFLHAGGTTTRIAGPGDPMPGGGTFVTASFVVTNYHLSNSGDIAFNARLSSDDNGDGVADTGLFVWRRGELHIAARTGTELPDIGTVAHLAAPINFTAANGPRSGALINDRGEIFFQVTLADGSGALLLAVPSSRRPLPVLDAARERPGQPGLVVARDPQVAGMGLSFTLVSPSKVELGVYDIRGRLVRTFEGEYSTGTQTIHWDALEDSGKPAATGIYLFRLQTEDTTHSAKAVWVR